MKSRLYVNEYCNPKIIEYFDYDLIKCGNNKLYRFTLEEEEYYKLKRSLGFFGFDDSIVSLFGRKFGYYGDWKLLKEYLDNKEIKYEYKVITLTREKRMMVQKEQFGLRERARISSYIRYGLSADEIMNYLNEYEYQMYLKMKEENDLVAGDSEYYCEHDYYQLEERN